jgi:hypothetical protein
MRTDCCSEFSGKIISLGFAVLVCGLIFFSVSAVIAVENPASSAFRDPYNGGIELPNGGGEPGKAYMAFINAAYRKDHKKICELIADPAEVTQCLQQKEAMDGYIAMFTQPKSHKVLGGFMKGDEATLNVAYTHDGMPQNTGFAVMKKTKEKWILSSTGGSGSGTVSATASGQVDFGSSSASGSANVGGVPGDFAIISISPNTKEYTGKCPASITWTASITFRMSVADKFSYHWELSNGRKSPITVVKTPRTGHMSVREIWKGGKPGEESNASVRFVAESGENSMTLDPPGVRVMCK